MGPDVGLATSPSLVLGLAIALFVVVGGVGFWLQRKRRERLAAWAATNGWTYLSSDDSLVGLSTRYPFGQGHAQHTSEVLRGRFQGRPALSFAYTWKTRNGKEDVSHTVHVVALALPAYLPIVEVTPEGVLDRVASAMGAQDLRFESEAFNRAFRVQAYDERTAYAVVHPRLMERLLQPDARGTSWRTDGTWILSWEGGATDLDSLGPRLGLLTAIVASVPRHVWQDHGFDPLAPDRR